MLGKYIDNHLQSSQGSTLSTGSGQDGFVNMDAIDLNLDLPQNNPQVQNGNLVSIVTDLLDILMLFIFVVHVLDLI